MVPARLLAIREAPLADDQVEWGRYFKLTDRFLNLEDHDDGDSNNAESYEFTGSQREAGTLPDLHRALPALRVVFGPFPSQDGCLSKLERTAPRLLKEWEG